MNYETQVTADSAVVIDDEDARARKRRLLLVAAVVIVAHRAGVLARVDRLLMMRDGAVQMEGPRDEILARISRPSMPVAASAQRGAAT